MAHKILNTLISVFSYGNDNQLDIRNMRYLPRWAVLVIDMLIVIASMGITFAVIRELTSSFNSPLDIFQRGLIICVVYLATFLTFKTYAGLIRHSSNVDAIKLLFATGTTFGFLIIGNYMYASIQGFKIFLTVALLLNAFIAFTLLYTFRLFIKRIYEYFKGATEVQDATRVLIYGVNENSISIASALDVEHSKRFEVVGFLSENQSTKRLRILNKPVLQFTQDYFTKFGSDRVDAIMLPEEGLTFKERYKIVDDCLNNNVKVYKLPHLRDWVEGKSIASAVKSIQIEDLLNRKPIELDNSNVRRRIENRTILVTGGAGSIGSEIVRQVALYNPSEIIVFDQAETPLHNLSLELSLLLPEINFTFHLGDVRNRQELEHLFSTKTIDYVYHAAAYKHVPLIEHFPSEGVRTNIEGTMNVAELSLAYGVRHFVFVSTDKAVNPTNVMGASKRVAELYVQSRNFSKKKKERTKFITTRFGNVLGSNGSVVPLFKKQIAAGGPVTITHPEIIRYFMTISEACQLVLEAGAMGKGGEIFVFDMGAPVKIKDLAYRMIQLAGFIPEQGIKIKYTGLRPGEKLYEELLSDDSITQKTHHQKILISKDGALEFDEVRKRIKNIISATANGDTIEVVKGIKELVPNFKSNNSKFETLDKADKVIS